MNTTNMQFKVVPARRYVIARGIRTIEAEEHQGVLHHLLSLKRYCQLLIFVRNTFWSIRREGGISGDGEDDCGLQFLAFVCQSPLCDIRKTLRAHLAKCTVWLFVERSQT